MSEDLPVQELLVRLRAGDEQAAVEVFHRFAQRLAGLARKKLGPLLRGKEDPEDAVQSAFRSFFRRCAAGQFELESWESLWGLLTRITLNKCGHRIDRFRAACRDVQRETPNDSNADWEPLAREPTPTQAALLAELVEQLHQQLCERDRRILALRLEGDELPEISSEVGCSERTVFRVLERIRQLLRSRCEEDVGIH